jgi:hypothetical protein
VGQLPQYSEADIDASAELNLQLDLQRQPGAPDAAALASLRAKTRADVVAGIERERRQVETGLGAGLIALVAAVGNLVLMRLANKAGCAAAQRVRSLNTRRRDRQHRSVRSAGRGS